MGLRNSIVYLAKNIKLDKEYRSVLKYSETEMLNLVTNNSNLVYSSDDYSFIRETGAIQIKATYSTVCQANYIAFQNRDYSNKWFFGFIDEVVYKGDLCTEIHYSVDVWSTWFSYWNAQACFVVREHVTDDTLGAHTIPEQVETGEYIATAHLYDTRNTITTIVMGSNNDSADWSIKEWGDVYNGIPSGVQYYQFNTWDDVIQTIQGYASVGAVDTVTSIFIAPTWLAGSARIIQGSSEPASYTNSISRITALDGYTPKNKKLLTYPYCYILGTNGAGASAIYHQELWSLGNTSHEMEYQVKGVLTPGCSIRMYPLNYAGDDFGVDYGLTLGKFPQLNWPTDQYLNWLTQNGTNIFISAVSSGVSIGVGAVTGNPIAIGSGVISVGQTMAQLQQHELQPPQLRGNLNSGDVNTALGVNCFKFYRMTIKSEFARSIDNYLSKVGYKVNTVKVPNMSRRENFNFVQIGAEDNVAVANNYNNICPPASDLNEINNLFRRGITIWNNHTNLGNYSVSNNITNS